MPSGPEWFIVLAIVLVIFGGSQVPKLARNLGKAQRDFKESLAEAEREAEQQRAEADAVARRAEAEAASRRAEIDAAARRAETDAAAQRADTSNDA
jgi:sec-independent protein translocase protein TatA